MNEFSKYRIEMNNITADASPARKSTIDPPGYSASLAKDSDSSALRENQQQLAVSIERRQQALLSVATSPIKNVAMMSFMMYMAGTQLHFFSIMATLNGLYSPLNAILNSGKVFRPDPEGKLNILGPRLLYCLIHIAALSFAVYRIHLMGLLPTHLSDWVAVVQAPKLLDRAVGSPS